MKRLFCSCIVIIAGLTTSIAPITLLASSRDLSHEPITPIAVIDNLQPNKVQLGNRLFHEPRLSADNTISCAHCHPVSQSGTDGLTLSIGIYGQIGDRNTPTVLNSGLHFAQFWDGRAKTLEEQIDGPITNPKEMGSNWPDIIHKLRSSHEYRTLFSDIYPDGITANNIRDAIATYEHSLLTPNSRFDRYLKGEQEAITTEELEGYQLFKSYGCISCHQGQAIGGNIYEKLGVVIPYYDKEHPDKGRFTLTGKEHHRYQFKVPSLRNVALTAPYLHDGSIAELDEVVQIMGRHQLGRRIPKEKAQQIVAFLKTLTGHLE